MRGLQTSFKDDVAVGEVTKRLINQQVGYGWSRVAALPVAL